jgi:peptidyl-prolyl cis-trans isomerase B (cyclophilin B)
MKKRSKFIACFVLLIYMLNVSRVYAFSKGPKIENGNINKAGTSTSTTVNPNQPANKGPLSIMPSLKATQVVSNFDQFGLPTRGEEIAVITLSANSKSDKVEVIRIRLFPQYAPNTVDLFKKRIISGYYNGLSINRIIANSYIQGGTAPETTISSSLANNSSLDTFSLDLRNFRGAVSTVVGDSSNSLNQFIIVQSKASNIENNMLDYMGKAVDNTTGNKLFSKDVINKYKRIGGAPWLDSQNVVFGQVIQSQNQGMSAVDNISKVAVDDNNKPKKDIKIIKIELMNYK